MYTKILVPLDGSGLSESILPYARAFAKALQVPVELLHAIDPEIITRFTDPRQGRYVDVVEADMRRNGLAYLKRVAASFKEPPTVHPIAEIGKPAEVIVDRAAAQTGTLIAMATRGRSGVQRWFLGSVADKVVHAAASPLLLVRAADGGKTSGEVTLNTVVVPLDGSPLAERALPHIAALAKRMKLEVVLVRVHSLVAESYLADEYTPNIQRISEEMRQEARAYLERKVLQMQAEGLDRVSSVLLEGNAAAEIVSFAKATPENLVAMTTHGRSGVGRWVLGSVAEKVIKHSGDPVLVVRTAT
jgi:nucleotide-binding universal stress UspA family protein